VDHGLADLHPGAEAVEQDSPAPPFKPPHDPTGGGVVGRLRMQRGGELAFQAVDHRDQGLDVRAPDQQRRRAEHLVAQRVLAQERLGRRGEEC
jgi:hypothetical protein